MKKQKTTKLEEVFFGTKASENLFIVGLVIVAALLLFNQAQVSAITSSFDVLMGSTGGTNIRLGSGSLDLSSVDVESITSTPMAVATVFPELQTLTTEDEIVNFIIPTGTPEYSDVMGGISFDDPVTSINYLGKWYYTISEDIKKNNPQIWNRYINLAAAPRGISCEFCCGVGPQGISKDGQLRCGCKHNSAVQALTLGLMKNTDYSDAQILREVMRWKAMFFPRNMAQIALEVAGSDPSSLKELPGMVGGC